MMKHGQNIEWDSCWKGENSMTLPITPEMRDLINKVYPYLNEKHELPADAPEDIKEALAEYRRLGKEQEEFALSL